jgi:hypothetical protein
VGNYRQRLPKGFGFPILPGTAVAEIPGTATLNPNQKFPADVTIYAPIIPLIAKARKHLITLIYYGNINYDDVFGKRRTTPFCVEYFPDYKGGSPFWNCPEHNTPEQGK